MCEASRNEVRVVAWLLFYFFHMVASFYEIKEEIINFLDVVVVGRLRELSVLRNLISLHDRNVNYVNNCIYG